MTEIEVGADRERRRILGVILAEYAVWKLAGELRIANALDALVTTIEHDHREDSER